MAEIVDAGAQRISVGGALTWTAVNAFAAAATRSATTAISRSATDLGSKNGLRPNG